MSGERGEAGEKGDKGDKGETGSTTFSALTTTEQDQMIERLYNSYKTDFGNLIISNEVLKGWSSNNSQKILYSDRWIQKRTNNG
jgi:lysozyme family protein